MVEIINQIFALESKLSKTDNTSYNRYFERIHNEFKTLDFHIVNPLGKVYKNEMTDVEANIMGDLKKNSKITKVLKPIIYKIDNDHTILIQKGIVIVA